MIPLVSPVLKEMYNLVEDKEQPIKLIYSNNHESSVGSSIVENCSYNF